MPPNQLGEYLGARFDYGYETVIRFAISSQALPKTETPLPITLRLHKLGRAYPLKPSASQGCSESQAEAATEGPGLPIKSELVSAYQWYTGEHITNVNSFGISV